MGNRKEPYWWVSTASGPVCTGWPYLSLTKLVLLECSVAVIRILTPFNRLWGWGSDLPWPDLRLPSCRPRYPHDTQRIGCQQFWKPEFINYLMNHLFSLGWENSHFQASGTLRHWTMKSQDNAIRLPCPASLGLLLPPLFSGDRLTVGHGVRCLLPSVLWTGQGSLGYRR